MSAKSSRLLVMGVTMAGFAGLSLPAGSQGNPPPAHPAPAEPELQVPQEEFRSELDLHETAPIPEIELPPLAEPEMPAEAPVPPRVGVPDSGPPSNVKKVESVPSRMPVVDPDAAATADPEMLHEPKPHPRSDMPIVEIEVPEQSPPSPEAESEVERPDMPMNP